MKETSGKKLFIKEHRKLDFFFFPLEGAYSRATPGEEPGIGLVGGGVTSKRKKKKKKK